MPGAAVAAPVDPADADPPEDVLVAAHGWLADVGEVVVVVVVVVDVDEPVVPDVLGGGVAVPVAGFVVTGGAVVGGVVDVGGGVAGGDVAGGGVVVGAVVGAGAGVAGDVDDAPPDGPTGTAAEPGAA